MQDHSAALGRAGQITRSPALIWGPGDKSGKRGKWGSLLPGWARSAVEQALCVGERGGRRGRRPVGVSAARLSRGVTGCPLNGRSGEHLPLSSSSPSQGFHLVTSLFFITRPQAPNAQEARSKSESSLNRETRFLLFTRGPLGPGTV